MVYQNLMIRKVVQKRLSPKIRKIIKEKLILKNTEKTKMSEKELLTVLYRDNVNKLEDLLGRKLPWKNFHN